MAQFGEGLDHALLQRGGELGVDVRDHVRVLAGGEAGRPGHGETGLAVQPRPGVLHEVLGPLRQRPVGGGPEVAAAAVFELADEAGDDLQHQRGLGGEVVLHRTGSHTGGPRHLMHRPLRVALGVHQGDGRVEQALAGLLAAELVQGGGHGEVWVSVGVGALALWV